MASEASGMTDTGNSAAAVIARQDRIPVWSLSYLFIDIIGVGFLFTFLDLFRYSPLSLSATKRACQAAPACIRGRILA